MANTKRVQLRRGTTAEHAVFTGAEGELTIDTTRDIAVVHDGVTPGGHELVGVAATQSLSNKSFANYVSFGGTVSFANTAYFGDNDSAFFGDGNDLRIAHDGSNSFIQDVGTGILYIQSNGTGIDIQKVGGENLARFITDGAVELYHDNSKKLETVSTGATITGDLGISGSLTGTLKNYSESINALGNTGAAVTINLVNGNFVTATLTDNCTFTFNVGITTGSITFTLFLTNDATPSRSITWPISVKWPNNSVPVRTTAANKTDVYTFFSFDGGTNWYGNLSIYNYS